MSIVKLSFLHFFRCRAIHRRSSDFAHDNCCLANTAALQLRSNLNNNDVIYVSYENEVCEDNVL